MKCNQTGKVFKASTKSLSLEDGEDISSEHLKKGTELLLDYDGKAYPVTVMKVISLPADEEEGTGTY